MAETPADDLPPCVDVHASIHLHRLHVRVCCMCLFACRASIHIDVRGFCIAHVYFQCMHLCAYESCTQVKVLLQTQSKGEFRGVFHCIKDVVATHGVMGLYRGLLTPLVGSMAEGAVLFASYGTAQRAIAGLRGESSSSEIDGREIVRVVIYP